MKKEKISLVTIEYGLSMYGGWYANFFFEGKWQGIGTKRKNQIPGVLKSIFGNDVEFHYVRHDH